tara:strand:+ start:321 stop:554 length:234 start_codon:yes stop_codon:yes gene_type:complete
MFKNKVGYLKMLDNPDKLDTLLKILKANGVQECQIGDITLKFTHFVHLPAESVGRFVEKNDQHAEPEDDDLLYYSAR